jgi:hypothetical protein
MSSAELAGAPMVPSTGDRQDWMAHRHRRLLVVILALLVASGGLLGGVGPLRRMAWAAFHAPDRLPAFAEDPRIRCEPGAENLARLIAPGLPGAVATIERVQGRPFKRVSVYVFTSSDSFAAYGASGGRERGASWGGRTFIGPRVLEQPDTITLLVAHELSHAHLQQWMNVVDFVRLPSWFREGLATYASGGGGAETVTDDEARQAIREGRRIVPFSSGSLLGQHSIVQDGVPARLAYREASLFTAFIASKSEGGIRALIDDLINGRCFAEAVETRLGMTVDDAWKQFVASM